MIRYRTEDFSGSGIRDAASVMAYEVLILGNPDILTTLSSGILKERGEISAKLANLAGELTRNGFIDDMSFDDAQAFFQNVLKEIHSITGQEIRYALWLSDIDTVMDHYGPHLQNEYDADAYETGNVILSDLGQDGALYGYTDLPEVLPAELYLFSNEDRTWSAGLFYEPPDCDAVKLLTEQDYPAQLFYSRTDLNGSLVFERELCQNREDLLQSLNWLGQCGYMPLELWSFDASSPMAPELIQIFERAADRRQEKLLAAVEELEDNLRADADEPGCYYHVTLLNQVPAIQRDGLIPQIGERSKDYGEHEPAIYLFPSQEHMIDALENWLGEWFDSHYGPEKPLAILKVKLPDTILAYDSDVEFEMLCKTVIPPNCISFYDESWNQLPDLRSTLSLDAQIHQASSISAAAFQQPKHEKQPEEQR